MSDIDPHKQPAKAALEERRRTLARMREAADKPQPGYILDVDLDKANFFHLILLVPAGLMHRLMCWLPLGLRRAMLTWFGISAMCSPLFLWMAATKWLLAGLLGYALLSIGICWLIVMFSPEDQL